MFVVKKLAAVARSGYRLEEGQGSSRRRKGEETEHDSGASWLSGGVRCATAERQLGSQRPTLSARRSSQRLQPHKPLARTLSRDRGTTQRSRYRDARILGQLSAGDD